MERRHLQNLLARIPLFGASNSELTAEEQSSCSSIMHNARRRGQDLSISILDSLLNLISLTHLPDPESRRRRPRIEWILETRKQLQYLGEGGSPDIAVLVDGEIIHGLADEDLVDLRERPLRHLRKDCDGAVRRAGHVIQPVLVRSRDAVGELERAGDARLAAPGFAVHEISTTDEQVELTAETN